MKIHHLAFRTGDLARLERFYVDVLGLEVIRRTEGYSVWLDAGGSIVMLETKKENEPDPDPRSRELVCLQLGEEGAPAVVRRLHAAGAAIEDRTGSTLYLRDPDGRRIGLSVWPELLPPLP